MDSSSQGIQRKLHRPGSPALQPRRFPSSSSVLRRGSSSCSSSCSSSLRAARASLILLALLLLVLPASRAALAPPQNPNALYGIGAVLTSSGTYPRIAEIVDGGPAGKDARLKVNDRIAGVAQGDAGFVDCAGLPLEKVTNMIRGKPGTTVRLQIIPAANADPSKRVVIALIRAEIKIASPPPADVQPAISPEAQSKLDEATKKIAAATREIFAANIAKQLASVVQVTGLDAAGKTALENASGKAVDQALQKSTAGIRDNFQAQFKNVPAAQMALVFSQIDGNAGTYAKYMQTQSGIWPADQPAWKEALKQTLDARQAAAWDAAVAKQREAVEAQIGDFSKNLVRFAIDQVKAGMNQKVERIEAALVLPKDRRDKLNAAAQSMLDQFGKDTATRAEKSLLAMDDDQRKEVLNERNGYYEWLQPLPGAAWDQGLAKLLTPEETHRLQTAGDDRKTRRANAMGKLLLGLLDEKIALTSAQRAKLEPILQRLAKDVPGLVEDQDIDNYFNYSPSTFFSAISNANPDEIKAILDPMQWRHWQDVSKIKNMPDPNMYVSNAIQLPAPGAAAKPSPPPEPEDVERAISDFLNQKSRDQSEKILSENVLKAEDIARVVHLSDDAARQLDTAARGAADASITLWNVSAENMVRSAIGTASPETVKGRLDSIQSYQFRQLEFMQARQFRGGSPAQNVWDKTVKAVLTPDQAAAWKKETDARSAYLQSAIAAFIVAAFDQRTGLSPDQWAKLEPLVAKTITDNSEEFGNFFAYSQAWYLQSFSIFLPIAAIPEKDMKSILTAEQWEHWTGSNEFSNASQYWSEIDQNHQQSVKPKK